MNDNIKRNRKRRALATAIKKLSIEYKGDVCRSCDRVFIPKLFCFHHIDESQKSFEIKDFVNRYRATPKKFLNSGYKELIEELDKCMLLCHNCHAEIHAVDVHCDEVEKDAMTLVMDNTMRKLFNLKLKKKNKNKVRLKK